MEFLDATEQIQKTTSLKQDELLYSRWIIGGYDKEVSFSEFKNSLIKNTLTINQKPEEILSWLFDEIG